jgi:two-component system, cell cycle sensor histidine kinase and response regulator CckA
MKGTKKRPAEPEIPFAERFDLLRKQAEEELKNNPEGRLEIRIGEATRLIHELEVHHIELEMQNDELRRTQNELEKLNEKLKDVYDYVGAATWAAVPGPHL